MTSEEIPTKVRDRRTILIAGVAVQLCAGIIYMWSVFMGPVVGYLSWNRGAAVLVTSIMMTTFVLGMIGGGKIMQKRGARFTAIVGSITMSLGIFATAFVQPGLPELLYLTYAIVGGFGVGIVYTCTVSNVQKWYFDKRGFATGVMVGAFGFSMVIFAPLADKLLSSVGVPETFMIFGIAFLVICTLCSMMLTDPPEGYTVRKEGAIVNVQKSQKQYTTGEMIRTKSFYLLFMSMFFVLPAFFMLNPLLKTLGIERGLTNEVAVFGVMLVGICSASGRLLITWLSDRIGRDASMLLIIVMTAVGITAMIFAEGYMFLVCLAVIALAFGGVAGVYPTATADRFGTKNMGVNYGVMSLAMGASSLVSTLMNSMLSKGGDYTMSFAIAAATCAISLILVLALRRERSGQPAV